VTNRPKIVIIGAGFGGISLAKKLSKSEVEIVLIDKNNFHTFQPLLYQVATGGLEPSNIAYPVRRVFRDKPNVKFRMAEVKNADFEKNTLHTSIGEISYDYLVIATGSTNNFFNFAPIQNDFYSLKTVSEALNIRNTLMTNLELLNNISDEDLKDETVNISIVGAGPAGIEIAGALAEMKKKVLPKDFPEFDFSRMNIYLFEAADKVLASMSPKSSKAALEYLKGLDVSVMLNAKVQNFDKRKVYLEDGTVYKSSTVIWTAGVKAATIEGFTNENLAGGRIKVNEFNQVNDYKNVFAIGDVATKIDTENPKGLPMLAQVAIQQGNHLSKNLIKLIENKPMKAFKYFNKGIMATIGRNKAVVELPQFEFRGRFAWFVWMFVHLMSLVGFRNKLITFVDWAHNYFSYDRPLGAIIRKFEKKGE